MDQTGKNIILTAVFVGLLSFMVSPALSATPQPPFLGPPNKHANTQAGTVDVGGGEPAYPTGTPGAASTEIEIVCPWGTCDSSGKLTFTAAKGGGIPGKYEKFTSSDGKRTFTLNKKDADGYYIGGKYETTPCVGDSGELTLEKSAGSSVYDQVRLEGTKAAGGAATIQAASVDTTLSLVQQNGFIGVANIASVAGAVSTCGSANANTQIWLPLGTGSNGQSTVILDINGDGVPDPDFVEGPPTLSSSPSPSPSIPTLNEWGLIVLVLMLLVFGLRFARNREPLSPA